MHGFRGLGCGDPSGDGITLATQGSSQQRTGLQLEAPGLHRQRLAAQLERPRVPVRLRMGTGHLWGGTEVDEASA